MYKRQILFCCLTQLTIVMPATTSIIDRVTDTTPKSTASTTSSTISPDTSTTTTAGQCAYHDLVYKDWDDFIANYHCQSPCWCIGSQMICAMCTPPTSTVGQCLYNGLVYNDGETLIANDYCGSTCWCMGSHMICTTCPPQTSTSTTSSTISPDTSTTPIQCLYNSQLYNEGDIYNSIDDCNTCSCGWFGTTCTQLFCPNTRATTTPISFISPDFTSTSATSATSSTISPDSTLPTTGQCIYNGQVYNNGENIIANDYCQSSCWCMDSQMICTTCPPQTSTSTTSSTISPDTSSPPRQCIYNGQVYNDGDNFIANNYCQSYCWCIGSQMICTMCPTRTSTSTASSTISSDTSTTPTSTTSSTISPDTSRTPTAGQCVYNGQVYNDGDNFIANDYCQNYCWCMGSQVLCTMCPTQTSTLATSSTISPDTTTTTTPTRSTTLTPYISRSTDTKKRRRTTLPALNTKTKKFHADVFDTTTKKPHFTNDDSRELGSKRTAIDKGNRNVNIR